MNGKELYNMYKRKYEAHRQYWNMPALKGAWTKLRVEEKHWWEDFADEMTRKVINNESLR